MTRHWVRLLTLRDYGSAIYARGLVRSEADANKWYVARVLIEWTSLGGEPAVRITGSCTCPAFQYRKPCKHITWLANKALAMARAGARAN